jgi:tRNA(adenine34) deaminase
MSKAACGCGVTCGHDVNRRRALSVLGGGLVGSGLWAPNVAAHVKEEAARPEDERFMRMAIAEASKADVPFGAIIVRDGKVLAAGRNLSKTTNDPTAHGEMVAIRRFVAVRPAAELEGVTLYTSGEPCPMCMGAIIWCGVGRLVYGASITDLSKKLGQIMLSSEAVANAARFANVSVTGGVLSEEALALFSR